MRARMGERGFLRAATESCRPAGDASAGDARTGDASAACASAVPGGGSRAAASVKRFFEKRRRVKKNSCFYKALEIKFFKSKFKIDRAPGF